MKMTVAIACDHGGYELKEAIKAKFPDVAWMDLGTNSAESVDYPDYADKMADAIADDTAPLGILICGTGIGISIAANRNKAVRAALCTDSTMAKLTRQHNDANVLALGARITGVESAFDIVDIFINTEFEGGRHARRIEKMS
jgi:ribose 5-phosphate isomerase B